jgi:hypothetical protein
MAHILAASIKQGKTQMKSQFKPEFTAFMLVKTTPEWLGFSVDRRHELAQTQLRPILQKHAAGVSLRFFDVEFYAARVSDVWMWDAKDHRSWQLLVEELRETPFWDRYFEVVEILIGVEDAYAINYNREALTA